MKDLHFTNIVRQHIGIVVRQDDGSGDSVMTPDAPDFTLTFKAPYMF
jgi:hypothetical protein